jgi:hypothetical protein
MHVNKLIFDSVDAALSKIESIDKSDFYKILKNNYNIEQQEIGSKFDDIEHYKIDRLIVRCLHEHGKNNRNDRTAEISAFNQITQVFASEITQNIKKIR